MANPIRHPITGAFVSKEAHQDMVETGEWALLEQQAEAATQRAADAAASTPDERAAESDSGDRVGMGPNPFGANHDPVELAEELSEMTDEEALKMARETRARQGRKADDDELLPEGARRRGSRTRRSSRRASVYHDPAYPIPEGIMDSDLLSPTSFLAKVLEVGEFTDDTVFQIDPEKAKGLPFHQPNRNLQRKSLYTIKAVKPDGRLVQIPFEAQLMNNAGGDPADAIGLRREQRKGTILLVEWDTLIPLYCPAADCYAKANPEFTYFCHPRHRALTLPNNFNDAGEIQKTMMSHGVTTSRVWEAAQR